MESIYLSGSEDVSRAASRITEAASTMQRAADSIESTLGQFLRSFEGLVERIEAEGERRRSDELDRES